MALPWELAVRLGTGNSHQESAVSAKIAAGPIRERLNISILPKLQGSWLSRNRPERAGTPQKTRPCKSRWLRGQDLFKNVRWGNCESTSKRIGCGGSQPALLAPRSCGSLGWNSVVAGAATPESLAWPVQCEARPISAPLPDRFCAQYVVRYRWMPTWGYVRFTPKSGHFRRRLRCPLSANSGHPATKCSPSGSPIQRRVPVRPWSSLINVRATIISIRSDVPANSCQTGNSTSHQRGGASGS